MKTSIKLLSLLLLMTFSFRAVKSNAQSCGIPGGLGVSVFTSTATQLQWNAVPGATVYNIEIQNATGNNVAYLRQVNTTANTFLADSLTAGSNYKFKVRTRCGGTKSNWSPYYFFTSGSGQTQCSLPSGLSVNNTSATAANISWNPAAGALSYRLRVEDGQNNPVAFLFAVTTAQTSFTVNGLTPATNYKVKLRSNCGGLLHSSWTSWLPFTTAAQRIYDLPDAQVQLYPNPASEVAYLVLPDEWSEGISLLTVTDMSGKVVYDFLASENASNGTFEIPVNRLPEGTYLLSVRTATEEHHQRLNIVR